ncbi:unnamed protein product [Zymoseptoria tritici ST99CH_3D7]|uniref:Uncharacterized protein n=1 Tax=Zymoseptoria tritici (strain ST99CH_3D7) TaxID=1276538 RepID=A0A1X7S7W6_ZYMT9|nr:unnamed protein product [Zymoseptoria tritici ST99CH_3D7]
MMNHVLRSELGPVTLRAAVQPPFYRTTSAGNITRLASDTIHHPPSAIRHPPSAIHFRRNHFEFFSIQQFACQPQPSRKNLMEILDLTGPMRTVVVGQEPQNAVTWPEAVELPTSNYEVFQPYSSWLYAGRIPQPQDDIYMKCISWPLLAHAYVLGEAIQDCRFKDLIIDYMHNIMTLGLLGSKIFLHSDASEVITTIYNGTPRGSPVRPFLSQVSAERRNTSGWLDQRRYVLPNDFIFDMAILMARAMSGQPLARLSENKCTYHSHPIDVDDEVCANGRARVAA